MAEESKTWNQQLSEWYHHSGKTLKQIQDEYGINQDTLGDYVRGKIKNIDRISPERRLILYNLTGLDCFKGSKANDERSSQKIIRESSVSSLDDRVSNAENGFYVLCHALEMLRPYPDLRIELAKRLHQPDVGKLTSYLEGIYTDNKNIIPMIPKLPSKRQK